MGISGKRSWPSVWMAGIGLLVVMLLGNTGCATRPAAIAQEPPQGGRTDVEETIRTVIAEAQRAYESPTCDQTTPSWFPDQPPYVYFAAEDRVMTLSTLEDVVAYCQRLTQGRVSSREDVKEQTVHALTPDVAYVVTQSVQTTEWRDGQTSVLPTVETTVLMRQDGRWRIVYKHLSWSDVDGQE